MIDQRPRRRAPSPSLISIDNHHTSITTWDTHRDEQRYIGGLYEFLFSKRNFEETTAC